MQTKSIWLDGFDRQTCPVLKEDREVDVLIVGGGLTGLSTAYHLRESDLKIMVIERNLIGHGITAKTTGKLTYLQDHIDRIKKYNGLLKTKHYLTKQIQGMRLVKDIVNQHHIDCDLKKVPHCLFTRGNSKKLEGIYNIYQQLNIDVKHIENGIVVLESYVFHPLKYLYAIKDICLNSGVEIYEKTCLMDLKKDKGKWLCQTKEHTIIANHVVLALHYPYFTKPFYTPLKSYIETSSLRANKVTSSKPFSMISLDNPLYSMRYFKDYHIEVTHEFKEEDYVWSNRDMMSYDGLPWVGKIDENLYLGTAYNTWGMTNASIAGSIIANEILTGEKDDVFMPTRHLSLGKVSDAFKASLGYLKSYIIAPFKKSKMIIYRNKEAIYIDDNKNEHIVHPICPHLKCPLIFNEVEKTWDCPCHGSRFDMNGHVLEGPSLYDITQKKEKP